MADSVQFAVRHSSENRHAIVFVHGFGGDSYDTFGMMPAFVAGDLDLTAWDIWCFGYPTGLAPDVTGVWSSDPDLEALAGYFAQQLEARFGRYDHLALVAHSMGGLIVQRSLVGQSWGDRIRHVLLYGTPSAGLRKAKLGKIFKRQVRDMAPDSGFLRGVRERWADQFSTPPFTLDVVAGLSDQFVPEGSAHEPFAEAHRRWVRGNHLEMVKPVAADTDSTDLVIRRLKGGQPTPKPVPVAMRFSESQSVIDRALALEMAGQQLDSIRLLTQHMDENYDIRGTLAGRHKRRWLADPDASQADGERSLKLYREGLEGAERDGDLAAAAYNGINAAFMTLALETDREHARTTALRAKELYARVPQDKWSLATSAEADLHLGNDDDALRGYSAAIVGLDPRERASMLQQAIWTARLLDNERAANALTATLVTGI